MGSEMCIRDSSLAHTDADLDRVLTAAGDSLHAIAGT